MAEPRTSLVMATYNRARTLLRAIASALRQTDPDWELLVVDDGSTDDTLAVLAQVTDPRVRVLRHAENRGVLAARNTAFDNLRGAWVATLDSDDELVPEALATLHGAAGLVSRDLDAVGCNCLDARTGALTGTGLDRDRWIDVPTVLAHARGEHWGMFRRALLGARRFNPALHGHEGVLWFQLHDGARWYYLHRGLRVYHTDSADRLTAPAFTHPVRARRQYQAAVALVDQEGEYLTKLQGWCPEAYARTLYNAAGQFALHGDLARFRRTFRALGTQGHGAPSAALLGALAVGPVYRALLAVSAAARR